MRSAAALIADHLIQQGIDTVFGVPGESYLALIDALYERRDHIRFVVNKQEGGACFMADAWARMRGLPGVCLVTRGPGATNAAIGLHNAYQDSIPLVLLIGQVGSDFRDREAFQEIDYRQMFGQVSKWTAQIDRADRIPEYLAHAFSVTVNGRPGPVVLALPEDLFDQQADVADVRPRRPVQASPAAADLAQLHAWLQQAQRPIVIAGAPGWSQEACAQLQAFAQRWQLPVGAAFRYQDVLDNEHPCYVGDVGIGINPVLAQAIKEADLVIALGARLGEMTTSGYTLLTPPQPAQRLVHCHADPNELGRVYQPDLAICAGVDPMAAALGSLPAPVTTPVWAARTAELRQAYASWQQRPVACTTLNPKLDLWQVMQTLREVLPADTVMANGAGNFSVWLHRFWRYRPSQAPRSRTQLAPTSGAMGYGVPAAIGASLADPQACVVNIAGDGDFLMTGQEVSTAVQFGAPFLSIVFDNGLYGTIRMHQHRQFPGRVHATAIQGPDFAALADAYGGVGLRVDSTEDFEPALRQAAALVWPHRFGQDEAARAQVGRVVVMHLRTDPRLITPNMLLPD